MRIDPRGDPTSEADGACRICGTVGDLTFEHVPPKSVGNRERIEMLGLDAWLNREADGTERGRIIQRGSGAYSLCAECNNRAGNLYVPELAKWTDSGNSVLAGLDPGPAELDAEVEPAYAYMKMEGLFPGRFTKQMVTMLLALSPGEFGPLHSELTNFAADPDATGLPDRYQLYLALLAGPTARFNGGAGLWREGKGTLYTLELAYPPYAYILTVDEEFLALPTGNITSFAGVGIDSECEIELHLQIGFSHTPLPLDLRSQAALERDRKENEAERS
jgi:hypothetical protein